MYNNFIETATKQSRSQKTAEIRRPVEPYDAQQTHKFNALLLQGLVLRFVNEGLGDADDSLEFQTELAECYLGLSGREMWNNCAAPKFEEWMIYDKNAMGIGEEIGYQGQIGVVTQPYNATPEYFKLFSKNEWIIGDFLAHQLQNGGCISFGARDPILVTENAWKLAETHCVNFILHLEGMSLWLRQPLTPERIVNRPSLVLIATYQVAKKLHRRFVDSFALIGKVTIALILLDETAVLRVSSPVAVCISTKKVATMLYERIPILDAFKEMFPCYKIVNTAPSTPAIDFCSVIGDSENQLWGAIPKTDYL